MGGQWTGNARRLSHADRSEIERLIGGGETFAAAAAAVGCFDRSRSKFLGDNRRGEAPGEGALCATSVRLRSERNSRAAGRRRLFADIATRTGESALDDLARGCLDGPRKDYRAWRADSAAVKRGQRPRPSKLAVDHGCAVKSSVAYAHTGRPNRSPPA